MKKVIAIVGPSASGKTTLLNTLKKVFIGRNFVVPLTTRPKRENEINGMDYIFISKEEMINKIFNHEIISAVNYRDWTYAISEEGLSDTALNIGVFGIEDIQEFVYHKNIKLYVIYLTAASKIRLIRSLKREENPDFNEIYRRYLADDEDFYWFEQELERYNHICIDTTGCIDYKKIIKFIDEAEHEKI